MYLSSPLVPPTPAVLKGRFPRIPLPEPPSTLPAGPELQALFTLLPFMEKGVVLTSTPQGVYGKRFCQGRVFWTGPHTTTQGLHKMERNTEPVLLFSKDAFKQRESSQLFQSEPAGCTSPPLSAVNSCFSLCAFLSLVIRTGPLPFKRWRASSVRHHAVFRRRAEQHRRPVQKTHHRSGGCSSHARRL